MLAQNCIIFNYDLNKITYYPSKQAIASQDIWPRLPLENVGKVWQG